VHSLCECWVHFTPQTRLNWIVISSVPSAMVFDGGRIGDCIRDDPVRMAFHNIMRRIIEMSMSSVDMAIADCKTRHWCTHEDWQHGGTELMQAGGDCRQQEADMNEWSLRRTTSIAIQSHNMFDKYSCLLWCELTRTDAGWWAKYRYDFIASLRSRHGWNISASWCALHSPDIALLRPW